VRFTSCNLTTFSRPLCLFWLAVLAIAGLPLAAQTPAAGWKEVQIPATGSYFQRYVPRTLDPTRPAPVVVFLHGAGGRPELYRNFVLNAAENAACVVVLPKSSSNLGWGIGNDATTVQESLRLVREEISVDPRRVAIAGHSAGGAYAYLLAYGEASHYSAVFSMSAPSYPVSAVADPAYKAPIRMYYGTEDPNYGSAYGALKGQWDRLGVRWEEDIRSGFGHNTWPTATMTDGFRFLVSQSYPEAGTGPGPACVAGPTRLCLQDGRFQVEVAWRDFQGGQGVGSVVPVSAAPGASGDSGLFWFFDPANWEMLVKVIDGCTLNNRFWVFAAATTNVQYTLEVTDTSTGQTVRYENPLGRSSPATTDTQAFASCP
jgi:predicted esterase